jgi:hypothetical protein
MVNTNITEIKRRADIRDVWSALGGGKLRGNRGRAFWRNGTGFNVALYPQTDTWHDFVTGDGGDVVALVETVQQCDFKAALRWLADFTGMGITELSRRPDTRPDTDWPTDLRWATWWKMTAEILAEMALASLESWDPQRRAFTEFLRTIRLGDSSLVSEFRERRRRYPQLTAAMCHAGRLHDARVQRRLALWLRRYLDEPQSA